MADGFLLFFLDSFSGELETRDSGGSGVFGTIELRILKFEANTP